MDRATLDEGSRVRQTIRLWVEDNGVGIPPEHHERVGLVRDRVVEVVLHPHRPCGHVIREERGGRYERDVSPEGVEKPHVRPGDARVQDVADDRHPEAGQIPSATARAERRVLRIADVDLRGLQPD